MLRASFLRVVFKLGHKYPDLNIHHITLSVHTQDMCVLLDIVRSNYATQGVKWFVLLFTSTEIFAVDAVLMFKSILKGTFINTSHNQKCLLIITKTTQDIS